MIRTVLNVDQQGFEKLIQDGFIIPTEDGYTMCKDGDIELMERDILFFEDEVNGETVRWNPAKEKDPRVLANNNAGNGSGFRFSPFYHPRGQYFQRVLKKMMTKAISTIHSQIVSKYDESAYKFDDPRLFELNAYLRAYISTNFQHEAPRKLDFMDKIVDIVVFLMKEDVYYRARFLEMLAGMPRFEIDKHEKQNIRRWR